MIAKVAQNLISKQLLKTPACYHSTWAHVEKGPDDPILSIFTAYKASTDQRKVNLGIGAYRDDKGIPVVLPSVKQAEKTVVEKSNDHEYLPMQGLDSFVSASQKLAFGESLYNKIKDRMCGQQVLSGTGGLRVGYDFVHRHRPGTELYCPNPTWPNHTAMAALTGIPLKHYNYYNPATKGVNFDGVISDLKNAPDSSMILLHACAHNPTGCDLSPSQWEKVLDVVMSKKHIPFIDMAYQGFTSGSVDKDAFAVRLFAENYDNLILAQSYAKNMGMYGQRIGCLSFLTETKTQADNILSHTKMLGRGFWSTPPLHGARIANEILTNPTLYQQWLGEVKEMAERIQAMRTGFVEEIKKAGSTHSWEHITQQQGMFAYTGVSVEQVNRLRDEFAVYLAASGRISIAGLNTGNIAYTAKAFHEVTKGSAL